MATYNNTGSPLKLLVVRGLWGCNFGVTVLVIQLFVFLRLMLGRVFCATGLGFYLLFNFIKTKNTIIKWYEIKLSQIVNS